MGTYRVSRRVYSINKLKGLTTEQYYGLKRQIIQNPGMKLSEEMSFTKEFMGLIILIAALPVGGILTEVHEGFTAIVVLSFLLLIFLVLTGLIGEISDFFNAKNRSEKYQEEIKSLILSSNDVNEFNSMLLQLNQKFFLI